MSVNIYKEDVGLVPISKTSKISSDKDNAIKLGADGGIYTKDLESKLNKLELYKFPNVTIIGMPTINNGQISNFSENNYLQFPFIVDFKNRPFIINIEFTTSTDVTTQQNIFDSDFGFAFAIRNSNFVIAMSSDGVSWDLGEAVGTYTILSNTTYKVKISWDGNVYKVEYSVDGGEVYNIDISKTSNKTLYPKQIYIGVGENHGTVQNFFKGSINFNYCDLNISDKYVWQGMDDVGMATRLAVDLSNIDDAGEAKIKKITDDKLTEINNRLDNINSGIPYFEYNLTGMENTIELNIENFEIKSGATINITFNGELYGSGNVYLSINGISKPVYYEGINSAFYGSTLSISTFKTFILPEHIVTFIYSDTKNGWIVDKCEGTQIVPGYNNTKTYVKGDAFIRDGVVNVVHLDSYAPGSSAALLTSVNNNLWDVIKLPIHLIIIEYTTLGGRTSESFNTQDYIPPNDRYVLLSSSAVSNTVDYNTNIAIVPVSGGYNRVSAVVRKGSGNTSAGVKITINLVYIKKFFANMQSI